MNSLLVFVQHIFKLNKTYSSEQCWKIAYDDTGSEFDCSRRVGSFSFYKNAFYLTLQSKFGQPFAVFSIPACVETRNRN